MSGKSIRSAILRFPRDRKTVPARSFRIVDYQLRRLVLSLMPFYNLRKLLLTVCYYLLLLFVLVASVIVLVASVIVIVVIITVDGNI